MNRLHGGDHAQLCEPRQVHRINVLRVFHSPAKIPPVGTGGDGLLVDVEHDPVGAITDGVRA